MEIDLHIHSRYSNDSRSKPDEIVKRAVSLGLGAIAVTDHNSWGGARAAAKIASGSVLVVPGAELKTDRGDLLALFVDEEIRTKVYAEAIDEIKARGGISIVPHPTESSRVTKEDVMLADGLEVFNSTCSEENNLRALQLGTGLKKPGFASSDAHMVLEIGNGRTRVAECSSLDELRREILKNPAPSKMVRSNPVLHRVNSYINFGLKGIWMR